MSESSGAPALILRVSAPVTEMSRTILQELTAKVAGVLGDPEPDARTAVAAVERVTSEVTDGAGPDDQITLEFASEPGALLIEARCAGRAATARHPLPS